MSYAHNLAERRPDLFTKAQREALAKDAEFRKWKERIDQQAEAVPDLPATDMRILLNNQGPVSVAITAAFGPK